MSQAVAASCCVPGLFRPYRIGDRYYLDGEVVRTLSADLAAAAGADVIIVSNVYRPEERSGNARSIGARRGAASVLRQSLSILLSDKERRGVELLAHAYPGVTFLDIAPDIGSVGYLNGLAARPLVLRGYRTALRVLANAKERGALRRVRVDARRDELARRRAVSLSRRHHIPARMRNSSLYGTSSRRLSSTLRRHTSTPLSPGIL